MIPLLDTHQHLIYRDKARYSWTDSIPALANKDFTLEDYMSLTKGLGIATTIFMEASVDDKDFSSEIEHIVDVADDSENFITGLISSCRPEESEEDFEEWMYQCEVMGVVGYRRVLHVVDDDVSRSKTFRNNIKLIGERDMAYDMCFLQRQLPIAYELAKECDSTRLVLDHCGVPDIAGGNVDAWRTEINKLASLENVYCKLSGLLAYCPPEQVSLDTIRPYVDHVLEKFGPTRIVWGSDWPVVNISSSIVDWLKITREILAPLSEDEATAIAHETAETVYVVSMPPELE